MRQSLFRILLLLAVLATTIAQPASARDRDPLAPVGSMEAPQFEAFPPRLVAQENAEAIIDLVNEARLFGVPLAVRVVSLPTDHEALSQFDDLDPSVPVPPETMREMAQAWMEREPIESSPGAADGFLMLVVMPANATLSSAIIEPGPNALPLNGLTQGNIDQVINQLVLPSFANNQVSQGIRLGLSVFSYNNLFGEPERIALDDLHQDLQTFAGIPLAGLTVASGLALVGLAFWIDRRKPAQPALDTDDALSPFEAGALEVGRVDASVITGGLLYLKRLGVIETGTADDYSLRIAPHHVEVEDPFAQSVLDVLRQHADADGLVHSSATRRLHDLMGPVQRGMENQLAAQGYINRDARAEMMWLLLASALVAVIAIFTLLPSIIGMARTGIFAIVFAALCIAGVIVWASRRSWTTKRGQAVLSAWQEQATIEELATFDIIANQDAIISAQGGPIVPETVNIVRNLRGIGAT